jgi:hypothetical protein
MVQGWESKNENVLGKSLGKLTVRKPYLIEGDSDKKKS